MNEEIMDIASVIKELFENDKSFYIVLKNGHSLLTKKSEQIKSLSISKNREIIEIVVVQKNLYPESEKLEIKTSTYILPVENVLFIHIIEKPIVKKGKEVFKMMYGVDLCA